MLGSYITVALRKLSRERLYVAINIFSLALGIASFLLLALYLRSELAYDKHHVNHDRIYRLTAHSTKSDGRVDNFAVTQVGLGPMLLKDYPQLGAQVRFIRSNQPILRVGDIEGKWDDIFLVDPSVWQIFTHDVVYGDASTAFASPYSIAISESLARYYFGNANPIGKTIASADLSLKVTLVFADLSDNTHLKYSALLPMGLMEVYNPNFSKSLQNTLFNVGVYTYLMVPPDFNPSDITNITKEFVERYMAQRLKSLNWNWEAGYQRLDQIHFGEKLQGDLPSGNIFYVYGFAAVAIFILLVACINYMNLATARATKRAKEVGMRKVLGAEQSQLIGQFLGESFTFTAIAFLVAFVLIEIALTLTPIGALMGKEHLQTTLKEPLVIGGALALSALVALVAGLYPAFYLSSISPLAALTEVKRSWRSGMSMRMALVLSQLVISIGVIACTWLMTDQLRYIHNLPLGFDKENRLIVTLRGFDVVKNIKTIKNELRAQPGVIDVTTISVVPGTGNRVNLIPTENNAGVFEPIAMDRIPVGINFVKAMNLEVIEGRGFLEDVATDVQGAAIVNESFAKKMGWDQALGKRFQLGPNNQMRVIGVVKDFHYTSLHNAIGTLMMHPISEDYSNVPDLQKPLMTTSIIVVLNGPQMSDALQAVETVIAKFDPKFNFEPEFLDDRLNQQYRSETNLMKLTGIFAGICIFIAVMGLYGLAAFTTEQRTKEIGIRMVIGASDAQIVTLLSRYLLPLIVVAAIPASLISYYVIDKWLQRFAYHTNIRWTTFVLASVVVALVAVTTVVLQSLKTTRADPIKALRYE